MAVSMHFDHPGRPVIVVVEENVDYRFFFQIPRILLDFRL
jgi:hypothetical protein